MGMEIKKYTIETNGKPPPDCRFRVRFASGSYLLNDDGRPCKFGAESFAREHAERVLNPGWPDVWVGWPDVWVDLP